MKFMRRILIIVAGLAVLCTMLIKPAFVYANEVVAVGTGSTFESALHDAMRIAIERSIGAFISSRTLTTNHQIITDEILIKSGGYIEGYEILRNEQFAGIFEVEAKIKVRSEELRSNVMTLLEKKSIVETNLNDPRISIIAVDENGARYPEVESEVTSALNQAGFSRIMSAEEKCDYSVRIYVSTTITSNKTYSSTIAVKMIATGTGEVIYAGSFRGKSRMFTNNSAAGAIESASRRAASAIASAALNRAASLEQHITIRISRVTIDKYDSVDTIKKHIRQIPGVNNVFIRNIFSEYTELDVNFNGTTAELASLLTNDGFNINNLYSSILQI